MKNGIVMIGENCASVNLRAEIPSQAADEKSLVALSQASLLFWESRYGKPQDNVAVPEPQKFRLSEDRYVYKDFRALSQVFLANRGLDFSRPGVLQAAVDLLNGKTIYANHDFRDIDNWRGVIANSVWDADGKDSGGVPGINCTAKVDAFLNYRTACGLMMTPPAINSVSVTVVSEVEFSHLDLVKNGTFWDHFLEEVDGEIVRLIVTKITEFWELSFVFMGEDRLAKNLPEGETDVEQFEVKGLTASFANTEEKTTEKTTMIITEENKTLLGITAEGDDVPEQTVLDAALALARANNYSPTDIADLSLRATAGEKLLTEKRQEVKRLAQLAEFGGDEGTLNAVVVKMIDNAGVEDLLSLETDYRKKAGDKFPVGGKSSFEKADEIEKAGDAKAPEPKTVKPSSLL